MRNWVPPLILIVKHTFSFPCPFLLFTPSFGFAVSKVCFVLKTHEQRYCEKTMIEVRPLYHNSVKNSRSTPDYLAPSPPLNPPSISAPNPHPQTYHRPPKPTHGPPSSPPPSHLPLHPPSPLPASQPTTPSPVPPSPSPPSSCASTACSPTTSPPSPSSRPPTSPATGTLTSPPPPSRGHPINPSASRRPTSTRNGTRGNSAP